MAKKLYRSKKDKMIAGVCGGIAESLDIDAVWIRLAAVLLAMANGIGIVAYIVAWIIVPQNPKQKGENSKAEDVVSKLESKDRGTVVIGVILLLVGLFLLFKKLFPAWNFDLMWPSLLIILGLYLLMRKNG
ncbi:PspC domain-containing protein [Nanoarchaeota archaeon]